MALIVGILLALFVVDGNLEWATVAGGGAIEVGEAWFWWRFSHRRRSVVGAGALVGLTGEVTDDGLLHVNGELWRVRGAEPGDRVRVVSVDGLTLVVERI